MKEFDVKITETLEKVVTVEAENAEMAQEIVNRDYLNGDYIVDTVKNVDISVQATRKIPDTLEVLFVKPHLKPQPVQIERGLKFLQEMVEGSIEPACYFDDPVAIIVNEEGKCNGLELNRVIYDESGNIIDVIAGNFLVVGLGAEDFCSLTPEQMEKFSKKFETPEDFLFLDGKVIVVK